MNPIPNLLFPPSSRYYNTETTKLETPDGREITYLKRRFLPHPENLSLLQEHVVTQGDRLDIITVAYFGDPLQFWKIGDANQSMNPADLTAEIGKRLCITLPEGVPGMPHVAQ